MQLNAWEVCSQSHPQDLGDDDEPHIWNTTANQQLSNSRTEWLTFPHLRRLTCHRVLKIHRIYATCLQLFKAISVSTSILFIHCHIYLFLGNHKWSQTRNQYPLCTHHPSLDMILIPVIWWAYLSNPKVGCIFSVQQVIWEHVLDHTNCFPFITP